VDKITLCVIPELCSTKGTVPVEPTGHSWYKTSIGLPAPHVQVGHAILEDITTLHKYETTVHETTVHTLGFVKVDRTSYHSYVIVPLNQSSRNNTEFDSNSSIYPTYPYKSQQIAEG
jgi:hypothetical protein